MEPEELLKILEQGESESVGFKELPDEDIGRDICAMANSGGGWIFMGVKGDGSVCGCDTGVAREFISPYLNMITPEVKVDFHEIRVRDREILALNISPSESMCVIGRIAYIRTGTTVRPLTLQEFMLRRGELPPDHTGSKVNLLLKR